MPTKSVTFGGVVSEDKPKEKRGFNCGALRSSLRLMGVNGTLMVGLVGSKLRKREDAVTNNNNNNNNNVVGEPEQVVVSSLPACPPPVDPPPFLWALHNSTTHLCNSSQDTLVTGCEEGPECKGLKKNLRGKLKKLVTKKPQQEVYSIPAELRPQLKQIYVY